MWVLGWVDRGVCDGRCYRLALTVPDLGGVANYRHACRFQDLRS